MSMYPVPGSKNHMPLRMEPLRGLALALILSLAYGSSFHTVTDPLSGRQGHVPNNGFKSRRSLAGSNCGAFSSCPSAASAAQAVVGSNPDLTVSNAIFSKGICAPGQTQWGFVAGNGWATGHPMTTWFPNGALVLSSGDASAGNCGLNTLDYYTLLVGSGGDSNLNALVPAYTTYDAVALEFDVTANKDGMLVFKYVFGSDEYTEWVGTAFNDVFGFFIAPSGQPITSGHNVAIVKGTQTQVSINNVNPFSNSALYINNKMGAVNPLAPIEADGYTQLLTTQGYQVTAGQTYHFKLAIADAGDQILDSWVWIGGQTLLVDTKPVANATISNVTTCTNKVVTLNASSSYDADKGDILTFNWKLSAPCYPVVSFTGQAVQVDLSKLANGVTYTVQLTATDKSEIEDVYQTSLFIPDGCGATMAPVCGQSPPPPPTSVLYSPPSTPSWPGTATVPPELTPPSVSTINVELGGVGVVACGDWVTITAGAAANEGIAEIAKSYDTWMFPVVYIWGIFDILDDGFNVPIAMKSTGNKPFVVFDPVELSQGRSVKKYRVALDVTDVDTWDTGNGIIVSTESFLQVLQCPIEPAIPLPVVNFTGTSNPESFTLACGTTVVLDATAPLADAVAKFGTSKPITTKTLRWTLSTETGTVVWTYDSTTATANLAGWQLEANGVITADTFYSLVLVIYINDKDYDNDNWETKVSIQACLNGFPTVPSVPASSPPPPSPPPPSPPPSPRPPSPPPSPRPPSPRPPSPRPPSPRPPPPSPPPRPPPPSPPPSTTTSKPPSPRPPSPRPPSPTTTTPKPPPPPTSSVITFNSISSPPAFTQACNVVTVLNTSAPLASSIANYKLKYPTTAVTSQRIRWSLVTFDLKTAWKYDSSTATTSFAATPLVTDGTITAGVSYTLQFSVRVNEEDYDADPWRVKLTVQSCPM